MINLNILITSIVLYIIIFVSIIFLYKKDAKPKSLISEIVIPKIKDTIITADVVNLHFELLKTISIATKYNVVCDISCKVIEDSAFYNNSKIESITFYGEFINENAFNNCKKLIKIICPNVINLGTSAFKNCVNLNYAYLPMLKTLKDFAFKNCLMLSEINDANNSLFVDIIGQSAFENCINLKFINLNNIYTLEINTFKDCTKLSKIVMESILFIKEFAVDNTTEIIVNNPSKRLYIGSQYKDLSNIYKIICNVHINPISLNYKYNTYTLEFLRSFSTIQSQAYEGDNELVNIKFYGNTINIKSFHNCPNLNDINLPFTNFIFTGAFTECPKLKLVEIPNIQALGVSAFDDTCVLIVNNPKNAIHVGNILIGDSIEKFSYENIQKVLIKNLSNFKYALTYKNEHTTIKSMSYLNDIHLYNIIFNGTIIESEAFKNCTNLRSINMINVNNININAFEGCTISDIIAKLNNYEILLNQIPNQVFIVNLIKSIENPETLNYKTYTYEKKETINEYDVYVLN